MPAKLYDWDEWFTKGHFVLRRGIHYQCTQSAMAQQIRTAASMRSLRIHIVEGENGFAVSVHRDCLTAQPGSTDISPLFTGASNA